MNRTTILAWLREKNPTRLDRLWRNADLVRRAAVGDEVHLRGLIEISNHCRRFCAYCGVRSGNRTLRRYRMAVDEIVACARRARDLGCGTVVLQAGEDEGLSAVWVAEMIRRVKGETGQAVTLSLGEREDEELKIWRDAGADRYLLRFETSNARLFERIHPPLPGRRYDRIEQLGRLREIGYEVGSGVMVGIPGQTHDDLAEDLLVFRRLNLDMIGLGPFVPHPGTPLGRSETVDAGPHQAPATAEMACRILALARILCPLANIPATTALDAVASRRGWELGLDRGANVVMPNLTPIVWRELYDIYPGKEPRREADTGGGVTARDRVLAMGRVVAKGPGPSRAYVARSAESNRGDTCLPCP